MKSTMATIVLATGVMLVMFSLVPSLANVRLPGNDQGYRPEQPIAYSHRLHAGELKIPCLYCHFGAEKSRHAGIPPASVCMNCHRQVTARRALVKAEEEAAAREKREARVVISPELQKLFDALGLVLDENNKLVRDPGRPTKPIAWVQVHALPDFVYFDHRRHVNAGVTCQTCHGPVETMERVRQVEDLSMGWCVNCHRKVNAEGVGGQPVHASVDCGGCHY